MPDSNWLGDFPNPTLDLFGIPQANSFFFGIHSQEFQKRAVCWSVSRLMTIRYDLLTSH